MAKARGKAAAARTGGSDAPAEPAATPADTTAVNSPETFSPDRMKPAAKRAVLVVRSRGDSRWRAGRQFTREPVELNAADLGEAEIAAIEGDPMLDSRREERD